MKSNFAMSATTVNSKLPHSVAFFFLNICDILKIYRMPHSVITSVHIIHKKLLIFLQLF